MEIDNIYQYLSSYNMIYHYTKSEIAINKILAEKNIKFSERTTTNDPFEHGYFEVIIKDMAGIPFFEKGTINRTYSSTEIKLRRELIKIINGKLSQISFCENARDLSTYSYDGLACLKPRMWSQYADNYKGICLGFDLEELYKEIKNQYDKKIYVHYFSYQDFYEMEYSNLSIIYPIIDDGISYEKYLKEAIDHCIYGMAFIKHSDYKDENEYRIVKINDGKEYFKFEKSLRVIVISNKYISRENLNNLMSISKTLDIPIISIIWEYNGIRFYQIQ